MANLDGQVCIITSHYYPESVGGEETFIKQYTEFLRKSAVSFTVVSASSGPGESSLGRMRIRPFSVPLLGFEAYSLLWAGIASLRIVKIHSLRRVAIIHTVETGYAGLAGALAALILRVPFVVHSHTLRSEGLKEIRRSAGDWRTWPYYAFERSIDKLVAERASKAIAVSTEVAFFLNSLGVPISRILIVPSAVDLERYSTLDRSVGRHQLGISDDSFVIGYLGRLAQLKGVEVLVNAYTRFTIKSPRPSLLLLAGDGPLRKELEDEVKERNLRSVRFLGFQSNTPAFLCSLDVFVLPSYLEGSPISLIEAMAAGCPIVASDISAVREAAEDAVMLFPPGDSSKLAELLMEVEVDPNVQSSLSASAKLLSKKYSSSVIMPRILAFYSDP